MNKIPNRDYIFKWKLLGIVNLWCYLLSLFFNLSPNKSLLFVVARNFFRVTVQLPFHIWLTPLSSHAKLIEILPWQRSIQILNNFPTFYYCFALSRCDWPARPISCQEVFNYSYTLNLHFAGYSSRASEIQTNLYENYTLIFADYSQKRQSHSLL